VKHFTAAMAALIFTAPLSAQQWETVRSWQGEPGTLVTETFQVESSTWRIVWNTQEQPALSTVFSVLVMAGPDWDVDETISAFEAGADTAYMEGSSGAYMLEIASTLPWSASVQQKGHAGSGGGEEAPGIGDVLRRFPRPEAGSAQLRRGDGAAAALNGMSVPEMSPRRGRQFATTFTYLRR
jgi:hypothetical protein